MNKIRILISLMLLITFIIPVNAYIINDALNEKSFNYWELNITFSSTTERNNIWNKITSQKHPNIVNFSYVNIGGLTYIVSGSKRNYQDTKNVLCNNCSSWYFNSSWETIEVYDVQNPCLNCVVNYTGTYNKSDRWINLSTYIVLPYWNKSSNVRINLTGNESQIGKAVNNTNFYSDVSDGNLTFNIFNSGNTLIRWNSNGATVVNNKIQVAAGTTNYFASQQSVSQPAILEWTQSLTPSYPSTSGFVGENTHWIAADENIDSGIVLHHRGDGIFNYFKSSTARTDISANTATDTNTHDYKIIWGYDGAGTKFYFDGNLKPSPSTNFPNNNSFYVLFGGHNPDSSSQMNLNNIRVYKYPTNEIEPILIYNSTLIYHQINITSWGNNFTNNQSLNFTANQLDNINFNISTNITTDIYSWFLNGSNQTHNFNNITLNLSILGLNYINNSVYNSTFNNYDYKNWSVNILPTPTPTPNLTMSDNNIYVTSDNILYGINKSSGIIEFKVFLQNKITSPIYIGSQNLTLSAKNILYFINKSNGIIESKIIFDTFLDYFNIGN